MEATSASGTGLGTIFLAFNVLLALVMTAIVGGISLGTGDTLLQDARATGEEHVSRSLSASNADMQILAGVYLSRVLDGVGKEIRQFIDTPVAGVRQMHQFIMQHDLDTITDPVWLETRLKPVLFAKMEPLLDAGTDNVNVAVVPFSPSYPNATARGADLHYMQADRRMGILAPGQRILMAADRRDGVTLQPSATGTLGFTAPATKTGHYKNTDKPCLLFPDFANGEEQGLCVWPWWIVHSEERSAMLDRTYRRAIDPDVSADAVIDEPNMVHISPMYTQFAAVQINVYMSLAHPDQVRKGPRHQGQFGLISLKMQGYRLSELLARQELPAGSLLYAVGHNHWTDETGVLVAVNKYHLTTSYYEMHNWRMSEFIRSIHVTNHTIDPNSTVLSPLARHGRAVLWERAGGYEGAVERTRGTFESWQDTEEGNSTEYWYVTQKSTRVKLLWYVSLLVPRKTVMEAIDASVSAIRTDSARAKADSTQRQEDSYILIGCVVAGAMCVMLLVSWLVARLVTEPIHRLRGDMELVAHMHLDSLNEAKVARISEVASMQQSFMAMVRNLAEYRNYMPDSLMMNEDVSTDGQSASEMTRKSSTNTKERSSASCSSRSTSVAPIKEVASVVKRRHVTIVCFNIKKWHASTDKLPDSEVVHLNAGVMAELVGCIKTNSGIQDCFCGDRLTGTFNAFSSCSQHRVSAALTATQANHRIAALSAGGNVLLLSNAIATGAARIGHMGCPGMKRVTILGPVMPFAAILEMYNSQLGLGGLVDAQVASSISREFSTKHRGLLLCPKMQQRSMDVFEYFFRNSSCDNDEWMYELQALDDSNPYAKWNDVWRCVVTGDWASAATVMETVKDDIEGHADLTAIVRAGTYVPRELSFVPQTK